jgi:hypothetical protein
MAALSDNRPLITNEFPPQTRTAARHQPATTALLKPGRSRAAYRLFWVPVRRLALVLKGNTLIVGGVAKNMEGKVVA